jgi:hypothetical protein
MGGTDVNIPGVFVGHSTGFLIAGLASAAGLVAGASADVNVISNGWSGFRI